MLLDGYYIVGKTDGSIISGPYYTKKAAYKDFNEKKHIIELWKNADIKVNKNNDNKKY